MTKISTLIRNHYLAIICFFVVGAFSIAPQFLAIKSLGSEYRGIPFFYVNDNIFYTVRIQEILDGHGWVNAPYIFEYKNLPSLVLPIGEYFYAIPAFVLGLSAAETAVLFNGFLLPAILFFLVYLLMCKLTKVVDFRGRINAIACGLLVILSLDLPALKIVWAIVSDQYKHAAYLSWVRPVNPITGAILLFCFLLLLWSLVNSNNNKRRIYSGVMAGMVLSLMVGYFFSWGTAASVWAVLMFVFLLKKDWLTARAIFFVGLLGFGLLLPYFYRVFSVGIGQEGLASASYGMSFTHQPVFNKILTLALLIFLPTFFYECLSRKKNGEKLGRVWWFCLSFILGGFIALNQQIITGRTVWYYHFSQYTAPLAIVAAMVPLYLVFKSKLPRIILVMNFLVILVFFVYGTAVAKSYKYGVEGMRELQKYHAVLSWLRVNGEKDCVVLIKENKEEKLAFLIPAFTQCNVYMTNLFGLSSVPLERAKHNSMIWMALSGATAENAERFLRENLQWSGTHYTGDWKESLSRMPDKKFKETVKQVAAEYRAFLGKDFLTELKKYKIDYLMSEDPLSVTLVKQFGFARLVGEFGPVYVYQ
ncbi:MAG: hypothetical protein AAB849_00075 [Patescibacteria group bacterium]